MSGRSRRLGVTPSFTWRRVAATTSAFMRTTSYRWRNLPALLGGLVQSRRSDLHVSTEPPPVSGSRQPKLGVTVPALNTRSRRSTPRSQGPGADHRHGHGRVRDSPDLRLLDENLFELKIMSVGARYSQGKFKITL